MKRLGGGVYAAALIASTLLAFPPAGLSSVAQARPGQDEAIGDGELAQSERGKRTSRRRRHDDAIVDPELAPPERDDSTPQPTRDDEVIADPELAAPERGQSTSRPTQGDEVIADPELAGSGNQADLAAGWEGASDSTSGPRLAAVPAEAPDPSANTGISRLQAIGMFGSDLHHEGNLEDAYETRFRFDAEVDFRRSRKTRVSVGTRIDLFWALPYGGDPDINTPKKGDMPEQRSTQLAQGRFELDILPLSGFVDHTLFNGFHLRVGEQVVSLARADFYSPMDMLAAFDLRGQPTLGATTGRLAQPAVRVDWDLSSWATLEAVYVPWFMPNLTRPNRDRYVANALGTGGTTLPATVTQLVNPGFQTKANEASVRFVGPAPDFKTPQAQARLNMRGNGFELAVNGGTALEKMPSYYLTPMTEMYERGGTATDVLTAVSLGQPIASVEYHRYESVGLDGTLDLSPLTLSFEATFSPSRHFLAATAHGERLPQPNVSRQITDPNPATGDPGNVRDRSIRKGVPVVSGALHVDWLRGERFVIALEGFFLKATQRPYDTTRDWWGFIPKKAIYAGGVLAASYRPDPDAGRWKLDVSVVGLVGPSLIVMPQVEYRVLDVLYLAAGAQIFEGPSPTYHNVGGAQNLNIGGLFNGYDQAYFGFRYVP